jgi:hypothetical protein
MESPHNFIKELRKYNIVPLFLNNKNNKMDFYENKILQYFGPNYNLQT